ncbi:hypothetical protein [Dysgonomonas sp. BGC7]|uniref:hypothetical protein n=2 Tax=Dysgonomonas sp. BGC7 TaxID=1658008 RepID=UPI0006813B29|nr:hypothetical protein [Dysgonomonas sp. BGC7]MBD8389031.1 hypothetical protein [Dysgonomonas sp. BGC7]
MDSKKNIMNKNNIYISIRVIILFITTIFYSCDEGYNKATIEVKIFEYIETNCLNNTKNCVVNISDITLFDWDSLFVINAGTNSADISKIIGINYISKDDFTRRRYFFVKDKNIVYKEDIKYDPSAPKKGIVIFGDSHSLPRYSIYKKTDMFRVYKITGIESNFYSLKLIE